MLLIGSLGMPEIIAILLLALLIFGPKKIPEIARSLGKGLREFKQGTSGLMDSLNEEINRPVPPPKPAEPQAASPAPAPAAPKPAEPEEVVIDMENEGNQNK